MGLLFLMGVEWQCCCPNSCRLLDQLHRFQARMPAFADNDVVMHGDAKR
jgi:hypothetical protein